MGRLNRAPGRGRADGRDARCLRRCASFLAEFNALETDGVDAATLGDTRGVPKTCSKAGQRRSFHHLLKSALNSETQLIQVAKPQTAKKGTKIIRYLQVKVDHCLGKNAELCTEVTRVASLKAHWSRIAAFESIIKNLKRNIMAGTCPEVCAKMEGALLS